MAVSLLGNRQVEGEAVEGLWLVASIINEVAFSFFIQNFGCRATPADGAALVVGKISGGLIDDVAANVESAQSLGWRGAVFRIGGDVESVAEALGVPFAA